MVKLTVLNPYELHLGPLQFEVDLKMTVLELKQMFSQQYPGHPPVTDQRMFISGKSPNDASALSKLFPKDATERTIHLCPKVTRSPRPSPVTSPDATRPPTAMHLPPPSALKTTSTRPSSNTATETKQQTQPPTMHSSPSSTPHASNMSVAANRNMPPPTTTTGTSQDSLSSDWAIFSQLQQQNENTQPTPQTQQAGSYAQEMQQIQYQQMQQQMQQQQLQQQQMQQQHNLLMQQQLAQQQMQGYGSPQANNWQYQQQMHLLPNKTNNGRSSRLG